jgi:hypothetical protein
MPRERRISAENPAPMGSPVARERQNFNPGNDDEAIDQGEDRVRARREGGRRARR